MIAPLLSQQNLVIRRGDFEAMGNLIVDLRKLTKSELPKYSCSVVIALTKVQLKL